MKVYNDISAAAAPQGDAPMSATLRIDSARLDEMAHAASRVLYTEGDEWHYLNEPERDLWRDAIRAALKAGESS